jgi:ABC-type nitrate/sulfonate/bicarbonate transport system substrate-binding protein
MHRRIALLIAGLLVVGVLLIAGCSQSSPPTQNATVKLIYANAGQMPQLLATGQIDSYMIWQPFVAVGEVSGLGTVVSYSQNLPPPGIWEDHSCDSLVARDIVLIGEPGITTALSAALIASTNYTHDNPDRAAAISADWIFGGQNLTFGNVTVSSLAVEEASIPTIHFTTDPSPQWMHSNILFVHALHDLGYVTGILSNASEEQINAALYDFDPYESAKAMIQDKNVAVPVGGSKKIAIGYLLSDHDAPLFVAVKEWQYFNDTYGVALKPVSETAGRVQAAELLVKGQKVADVTFVQGEGGAQLMTLMASNALDYAVAGTPPTISAIDKGTPIKILFPLHTEGSGLVVTSRAPVDGWDSFTQWIKDTSTPTKPVIIATVQGSIQDVQLRYALEQSNITVIEAK